MTTDEPLSLDSVRDYLVRYGGEEFPGLFVKARGSYVWDTDGRRILDFTSGQMCATIGHNHPAVVAAIEESARTAIHLFSGMIPESVARLATALARVLPAPLRRSLFVSTGSESNEAALKMAKMVSGGFETVALGGSWHGVTGAAGAASYASDRRGYGPGVPGTFPIPEPNAFRCPIEHCRERCDMTCLDVGLRFFDMHSAGAPAALICEPILSAGGIIVPPDGYFQALRKACDERGMVLIFDEAQTAFGRIGSWSAAEKFGVVPDIMTVSKTLGGGVPLGALVTTPEIEDAAFDKGFRHYTSHVSDPLPALVGIAVIETITGEDLLARALAMGDYLRRGLGELQQRHEVIGDIRGIGLLIGIELVEDRERRVPHHRLGAMTTERCLELGLSMNIRRRPERGAVWRIAPPLTVSHAEIDSALTTLDQALGESLDRLAR